MKIDELLPNVKFESEIFEFKKSVSAKEDRRWLKTVCGFSNAKGGHIYVGVDDAEHTLSPFSEKQIDELKQTLNNGILSNISPLPKYDIVPLPAQEGYILDVVVHKRESGITFLLDKQYGNQIFTRRDGQTTFATPEEIIKLVQNAKLYEFDKTVVGVKRKDVHFSELEEEYEKANKGEKMTEKLLKSLGLVSSDGFLTIAGYLFCDETPYGNANASCTLWPAETKGSHGFLDTKKYQGSLIHLLDQIMGYIHQVPFFLFGGNKTDLRRKETGSFSDLALREALINAMAHRDYSIEGNEIMVDCFKDRIEITSPGAMLAGSTIGFKRLDENAISQRRNPIVCSTFEKLKLMENKGSGFAQIVNDYGDLGDAYAPVFKTNEVSFTIRLINKKSVLGGTNRATLITASINYLNHINLFKMRQEIFNENANHETILKMIDTDKGTDYQSISTQLGITKDGAKYYVKRLRDFGLLRREGSARTGYYEVLNEIDRPADFMSLDDEIKQRVVKWCEKYFLPSDSVYPEMSSYGLKHILEQDSEIYLTNGQFKGAMLIAGFLPILYEDQNWLFKISRISPALFMEKKG